MESVKERESAVEVDQVVSMSVELTKEGCVPRGC